MTKKWIVTVFLVVAWACFATLFYKTLMVVFILRLWWKELKGWFADLDLLPERFRPYAAKALFSVLALCIWMGMPRWYIDSGDRVRLVYLDDKGETEHPPLLQYVANTLVPEEEVVNFGIRNVSVAKFMGIGSSLMRQANDDATHGKIRNFLLPYDNLGTENPMSGVYAQAFHDILGTKERAVYICEPKGDANVTWSKDNGFKYPLVVFCHGYLGNWKLYQGVWKDLNNCIVLSIGTPGLDGIFSQHDIHEIFSYYIPALERMGYHIDHRQIHLMGLSNGGSAIASAMHSSHAKDFKSITSISCNLGSLKKVPCQVNLIGGGKDNSSRLMPSQASRLDRMGVDVSLFFVPEENHFLLVNRRKEMIEFLKDRMDLKCVREK